ncbi:MAG: DUF262 domain-containing HNH endonuclease family protein, partial [archaeon]|nr:DUF262 domain-containing HNH endonuclease family protein [archaeon]
YDTADSKSLMTDIIKEMGIEDEDLRYDLHRVIGSQGKKSFKLSASPENHEFFINYIQLGNKEYEAKSTSDIKIRAAYESLHNLILERIKHANADPAETISSLTNRFLQGFRTSYVETDDISQAFTIFETLNARGTPLEVTDLLKNHFFSQIEGPMSYLLDKWKNMIDSIESSDNDVVSFIKYFWNSYHPFIREKELFSKIKTVGKQEVPTFMNTLFDCSELYLSIVDPDRNNEIFDKKSKHSLKMLKSLNASSFCPLVIALVRTGQSSETIDRMVFAIECLVFRNQTVGKITANNNERQFAQWAYQLSSRQKSPEQILDEIFGNTITDEEFSSAFKRFSPSIPIAKRILIEIYNEGNKELKINEDGKEVHLEHIMPQNNSLWCVDDRIWKEYHVRFGNMTLLDSTKNIKISNGRFAVKRTYYAASKIPQNQEIAKYESWTDEEIRCRQDALLGIVLRLWPRGEPSVKTMKEPLFQSTLSPGPMHRQLNLEECMVRDHSWSVIDTTHIVKKCDYSVFYNKGSGIPVRIRGFFGIENMKPGDKLPVTLTYGGEPFEAYFVRKNNVSQVTQIVWGIDFQRRILTDNVSLDEENYPNMIFKKGSSTYYEVWFQ